MFTWICPQCGREVSPSYDECPDCKARLAAAGTPVPPQPPGPSQAPPAQQPPYPPPGYQPVPGSEYVAPQLPPQQQPPVYYQQPPQPAQPYYQPQQTPPQGTAYYAPAPPQQPQYYQPPQQPTAPQYYPPQAQPPARHALLNLPPWLMTIVFAAGIAGILFGVYSLLKSGSGTAAGSGPTPTTSVENPAAKPGAKTNPLQKQIEITGVRFSQDTKKKTMVTFVIVNHSAAEIGGLAGNVTIWGSTKKSEEDAQGTFAFTTDLAPYQSKEISAPLNSKLKIYELADWQNITTDVQITAPAG